MNVRLNFLEAQYAAMKRRADADPRVLARYEALIEAEYRRTGDASGWHARLQQLSLRPV